MMSAICTQRSWQDRPLKPLNPIELNVVDALSATRGRQTRSAPASLRRTSCCHKKSQVKDLAFVLHAVGQAIRVCSGC